MLKKLENIIIYLQKANLEEYWTGFDLVAYALYDKNNVYLFNHPKFITQSSYAPKILKWNQQFVGNTLILYDDYPTAIVDMDLFEDNESLYSLLVHELFHGYQFLKNEERFPDEVQGFLYPVLKENVEMRIQEREYLFRAVNSKSRAEREGCINNFVALREKRANQMKDYQLYENLIETIEGPAWYVELKAYYKKSLQPYEKVLEKYGKSLLDHFQSSSNIRASCYSSGLFICLLLEDISPNWQESYFNTEDSLFEFFKQQFSALKKIEINDLAISKETEAIVEFVINNKEKEFKKFSAKPGFHLYIDGHISIKSFDPMNIISLENQFLHKNYLKVGIGNCEYLIQQPVIAYSIEHFRNISRLHLILDKKPVVNSDSLSIDGVGEIIGHYNEQEGVLYVSN